jgi:threonine synthase
VKALFGDREFNAKHHLGAVNSINWARILAQTVYYFLSYFHIRHQLPSAGAEIQYVVPTGNFGDVLAGYYAKRMGLPMGKLVVATNSNDILARFWKSGKYEKVDSTLSTNVDGAIATAPVNGASDGKQATPASSVGVKETLSPAMDILVSSNFERLLWYLAYETASEGGNKRAEACKVLDGWMSKVKSDGRVEVPIGVLELARKDFLAERISDEQVGFRVKLIKCRSIDASKTLETIQSLFESTPSYTSDPHTAVGFAAAKIIASHKYAVDPHSPLFPLISLCSSPSTVQIVLSTAHPAKFSEAVTRALQSSSHFNFERDVLPKEFHGLLDKEKRVVDVERPDVGLVKDVIEKIVDAR